MAVVKKRHHLYQGERQWAALLHGSPESVNVLPGLFTRGCARKGSGYSVYSSQQLFLLSAVGEDGSKENLFLTMDMGWSMMCYQERWEKNILGGRKAVAITAYQRNHQFFALSGLQKGGR